MHYSYSARVIFFFFLVNSARVIKCIKNVHILLDLGFKPLTYILEYKCYTTTQIFASFTQLFFILHYFVYIQYIALCLFFFSWFLNMMPIYYMFKCYIYTVALIHVKAFCLYILLFILILILMPKFLFSVM